MSIRANIEPLTVRPAIEKAPMRPSHLLRSIVLIVPFFGIWGSQSQAQEWKEAVGFNALKAEKGDLLEDGSIVRVMQPEAPSGVAYMPNAASTQFTDKTFTNGTGTSSEAYGHATSVGNRFYGNTLSMTPGIQDITGYDANDYIGRVLGVDSGGDPLADAFDVGNHSYIELENLADDEAADILQRFDFVINRDNTVMVVGTGNGSTSSTPDLMTPSYNAITVGLTSGSHSRGPTTPLYGFGRFKPDIVAPEGATSFSTPVVAGAAALLRHAGNGTNAAENEVIKSTLFAGATKQEFASWDRTSTRPIDDVYGFGELNILNSYHIFEGGEFDGSTTDPTENIGHFGWDYGQFDGVNDLYYDFEIDQHQTALELSAALNWNIEVTDNDADTGVFDASTMLANLDLRLYDSGGTFLETLLDSSVSTEYNLEHIYFNNLQTGSYTFRISGDMPTDFGFSWRIVTVPEPATIVWLGLGAIGLAFRRRRPIREIT